VPVPSNAPYATGTALSVKVREAAGQLAVGLSGGQGGNMRWLSAGIVLGIGLGGFVDGIVLHQILQWHNMGSAILPPVDMPAMSRNMVWDGLFHAATWAVTLLGVYMLKADHGRSLQSTRAFTGEMLLGWGAFNLVEGVIDHHLLALHHVRDLPVHVPIYDWVFLGVGGLGFIVIGLVMTAPVRRSVHA
jgi:uncharacterized membrane protein